MHLHASNFNCDFAAMNERGSFVELHHWNEYVEKQNLLNCVIVMDAA